MFISNITLNDFRIYFGKQELSFIQKGGKNISIVSGNNGFGKTTLLNALVWCLYGKLMVDVDEKYRSDIYEAGGYKKFATNNLNRQAQAQGRDSYFVSVTIKDIAIPSLPCEELVVKRSYNLNKTTDSIEILIDGRENELTREVGPDIFISDFLLPKEIAKFFFFDAEKIVSLAEMKSVEDRRKLSTAYSEVLGIKKYEDLKNNLEEIRIRLRQGQTTNKEAKNYSILQNEIEELRKKISQIEIEIGALKDEKTGLKQTSEQLQIKLIREGTSLTLEELQLLKERKKQLADEMEIIKDRLKDMMELAPFAISGKLFDETKIQADNEYETSRKTINPTLLKKKLQNVKKDIVNEFRHLNLNSAALKQLSLSFAASVHRHFEADYTAEKNSNAYIDFSEDERKEFNAIYTNLKSSFSKSFRDLANLYKNNRVAFNKVVRQLSDAETKETDLIIQEIRQQKQLVDEKIDSYGEKIVRLHEEIGGFQREIMSKAKMASELEKRITLNDLDKMKDDVAARMISEIEVFLLKLKQEKKQSLELKICKELNNLMHKKNFVSSVSVELAEGLIDIHLLDKKQNVINKETLSKGEQQLYATALLKSLVDESNISFPVFIDSPLQKFDKKHSRNIIRDFYPNVSEQVVLFPLIEKEMTEVEYHMLLPKVSRVYIIEQVEHYNSRLVETVPEQLFSQMKTTQKYVY